MRGQDETHGQGVRPEDPEQVGDAEEGGDGLLPGGEGRPRVRGQTVDHQPSLRLPRHHKLGEWKKSILSQYTNHFHLITRQKYLASKWVSHGSN